MGSNTSKNSPAKDFCENNVMYMIETWPGSCDQMDEWKLNGFNGRMSESSLTALRNRIQDAEKRLMSKKSVKPKQIKEIKRHYECLEMWEKAAEAKKQKEKEKRERNLKHLDTVKGPFQSIDNKATDNITNAMSFCFPSLTQPVGPALMSEDDDQTYVTALAAARLHSEEKGGLQRQRQAAQTHAASATVAQLYLDLTTQAETNALMNIGLSSPVTKPPPYDSATSPKNSNNPFTAELSSDKSFSFLSPSHTRNKTPYGAVFQAPMIEFPNPAPPPPAPDNETEVQRQRRLAEHPASVLMYRSPDPSRWTQLIKDNIPPINRGGATVGQKFKLFCQVHRPTGAEIPGILRTICNLEDYSKIQAAVEDRDGMNSLPTIQWDDNTDYARYVNAIVTALTEQFPARMDMNVLMSLRRGEDESVMSFAARARQHCIQHSGQAATAWTAEHTSTFEELFKMMLKNGLGKDIVKIMTDKMVGSWDTNRVQEILRYAQDAETRCANKKEKVDAKLVSTFAKMTFAQPSHFNRGRGRLRGRGRGRPDRDEVERRRKSQLCFICAEPGHWADNCPKKRTDRTDQRPDTALSDPN